MTAIRHHTAVRRAGGSARANRNRATVAGDALETSEARRADVYRTDVEFAPETPSPKRRGSGVKRVDEIRELYARGISQLDIAVELGMSQHTISNLIRRFSIEKGTKE
jgi:DNA-binding NarL/FixJ family response regulator